MSYGPGPDALTERWEYMFVLAVEMDRAARLSTVHPDGEVVVVDAKQANQGRTLALLNQLGRDGWQLVALDHAATKQSTQRTYWLKRWLP
jgi:ABC-type metal ion transport system substrate-binding protein